MITAHVQTNFQLLIVKSRILKTEIDHIERHSFYDWRWWGESFLAELSIVHGKDFKCKQTHCYEWCSILKILCISCLTFIHDIFHFVWIANKFLTFNFHCKWMKLIHWIETGVIYLFITYNKCCDNIYPQLHGTMLFIYMEIWLWCWECLARIIQNITEMEYHEYFVSVDILVKFIDK